MSRKENFTPQENEPAWFNKEYIFNIFKEYLEKYKEIIEKYSP